MLTNDRNENAPTGAKSVTNSNSITQRVAKKNHHRRHNGARKNAAVAANNNAVNSTNAVAAAILAPNANRRTAGANWNAAALSKTANNSSHAVGSQPKQRQHHQHNHNHTNHAHVHQTRIKPTRYIAMDCEMVGIGFQGRDDMLARVSIVDEVGKVLLDKFVKPVEIITDYRTPVSGIRPFDLKDGEEFAVVQKEVTDILKDRILVGHNIKKDLQVLHINHPYPHIRDTSNYKPLARLVSAGKTPSLKRLSAKILGNEIQTGEHNSIEDAKAAMDVYLSVATEWEKSLEKKHYRKH